MRRVDGWLGSVSVTWVGDVVEGNAADRRVDTKVTGDELLLTDDTLPALSQPPSTGESRGAHVLKGSSELVVRHALH